MAVITTGDTPETQRWWIGFSHNAIERRLRWVLGGTILLRLLFPFFNSPLSHLFSDPARHWQNGLNFLHPTVMGATDPFGYQLWLSMLQQLAQANPAVIQIGVGMLCALMPWGWYRALKEVVPRTWALSGAIVIALVPEFVSIYAYFMNETLLLTLTGFAFWATFRAQRKRTTAAFVIACAVWLLAGFTRSMALPMALLCLLAIWLPQPGKIAKAVLGSLLLLALMIPASLHSHSVLGWFAPFGNPYLNQIYNHSGKRGITLDFINPQAHYRFGSPSFYNPTFWPISDWTTNRSGTTTVHIDLSKGRADWQSELERVQQQRAFPRSQQRLEDAAYLFFGQAWPNNDPASLSGWLTIWMRWLWPIAILLVVWGAAARRFHGRQWLLPVCALGLLGYFILQQRGVMEARFRMPLDPILVAAAVVMLRNHTRKAVCTGRTLLSSNGSLATRITRATRAARIESAPACDAMPAMLSAITGATPQPTPIAAPVLSLVIPCHNESAGLQALFARILPLLEQAEPSHEIIVVNDGSRDQTLPVLLALQGTLPQLRVVDLSRNFGKEAAIAAGLAHCRGKCAILMDADLQDPPELIPTMLARWRAGDEAVVAVHSMRATDSALRRALTRGFYRLMGSWSDTAMTPNMGDFRLLDRAVVDAFLALPERTRFNKGLFAWIGFRQSIIEHDRPLRDTGRSSFSYRSLFGLALEAITSFSSAPLRLCAWSGGLIAVAAFVYGLYIVLRTLLIGNPVPGYTSIFVAVTFFGGVNLLGIGILGEYVGRVFVESKRRPLYLVRRLHEGRNNPVRRS